MVRRWRDLFRQSILLPLATLKQCACSEALCDPETIKRSQVLFDEVFAILWSCNIPVSKDICLKWTTEKLKSNEATRVSRMTVLAFQGRDTGIEFLNGWLVEKGRSRKPPILCTEHEKVMNEVIAGTPHQREKIIKMKEEQKKKLEG